MFSLTESDSSQYVPNSEVLRDTLREPLPPKQSVMPPKWLMTSTPESGVDSLPRTPVHNPAAGFSSSSASSNSSSSSAVSTAGKPLRNVSSAGANTQASSGPPLTTSSGPSSMGSVPTQPTKQPPLPPPKPINRSNNPAMLGEWSQTCHTRYKMTSIKVSEITSHNSFASSCKLTDKVLIIFSMGVDRACLYKS